MERINNVNEVWMEIYLYCTVDKALKKPSLILRNFLGVRQLVVSLWQCRTWVRVHKIVIPSSLAFKLSQHRETQWTTWWSLIEISRNVFPCLSSRTKSCYRAHLWGLLWETTPGKTKFMKFNSCSGKYFVSIRVWCSLHFAVFVWLTPDFFAKTPWAVLSLVLCLADRIKRFVV